MSQRGGGRQETAHPKALILTAILSLNFLPATPRAETCNTTGTPAIGRPGNKSAACRHSAAPAIGHPCHSFSVAAVPALPTWKLCYQS
uniref:Putative secreted protein n=1 Tax=Ixodes ricinus TaxID=34613 RepID=A0A6B0UFU7_IXORI